MQKVLTRKLGRDCIRKGRLSGRQVFRRHSSRWTLAAARILLEVQRMEGDRGKKAIIGLSNNDVRRANECDLLEWTIKVVPQCKEKPSSVTLASVLDGSVRELNVEPLQFLAPPLPTY